MVIQEEHFPSAHFIRYSGYLFPPTVISSAARNLPCTLLFLAPFAKGFPFSALSCSLRRSIPVFCYHTYGAILVCKKDPSASLGMTLRKRRFPNISFIRDVGYLFSPHTVISSAVEKSSLHSALSCFLRKRFPLFRCLTYGAIPVCKKDRGLRSG